MYLSYAYTGEVTVNSIHANKTLYKIVTPYLTCVVTVRCSCTTDPPM